MKIIKQISIIFLISAIGETLRFVIPLPIPGTVYGLLLMVFCLHYKIIRLESVKKTSDYLLEIMPIMFVPSTVGLMATWDVLKPIFFPVCFIAASSTFIVIAVSGKVTDWIMKKEDETHE